MADVDEFGLPVDEDEETESPKQDSDGIKQLRKAFKDKSKQLDEALARLASFEKKERAQSVGSLFESAGASPKLAKFFLSDLDDDTEPDEAAVKSWLDENGELFGYQPEDEADSEEKQSIERVQAAQQGGKPAAGSPDDAVGRLKALDPKAPDFYEQLSKIVNPG